MTFAIEKLTPERDRSRFRSGNPDLDRFFVRYAGQNQFRHHIGTTYVAVDAAGTIAGFATVAASELSSDAVSAAAQKRSPKYPLPVLRLARLAVDQRFTGRGVGSLLLRAVFVLAAQTAGDVGCIGIVLDAKPDAVAYYEKLGFIRLALIAGELGDRPEPLPMFLEIGQLVRAK